MTNAATAVSRMRGDSETQLVLISIVAALLFLSFTAVAQNKFFGDSSILEKLSRPILTGSEDILSVGANKYLKQNQDLLDKVNAVFYGDPLENWCSKWYSDCGGIGASPWKYKLGLTERDYVDSVGYLQCTNTDAIKSIENGWAKSDSSFNSLSDTQKLERAKNACKINLLDQISQQEALKNQN